MHAPALPQALDRLRRAARPADVPDSELLARFARDRDETAFAALVRRHGPLVLGVCRRLLGHHDAEDACQAVFLILARKATGLTGRSSVAGWLCAVAWNVARKSRRATARRAAREARATAPLRTEPTVGLADVCAALDAEVARLPDAEREAFTVCVLDGLSKARAARRLGWTEGTVSGRLARARERLRVRLARRGITLSAALTAVALAGPADALAPAMVAEAVRRACMPVARGAVAGLTRSVGATLLVGAALTAGVAGWLSYAPQGAGQPKPAAADPPVVKEDGPRLDFIGDPLPARVVARIGHQRFRQEDRVKAVAVSPDGKSVASATSDGVIHLWEAATGKPLRSWDAKAKYQEGTLRFLGRGDRLFVGFRGDSLPPHIADAASGRIVWKAPAPAEPVGTRWPGGAVLSADEKLLLEFWGDGTVRVFDRDVGTTRFEKKLVDAAQGQFIRNVRVLPDGKTFLLALGISAAIEECSTETGAVVRKYETGLSYPYVATTADGRYFAAYQRGDFRKPDPKDTVQVWDREKNVKVCTVERLFPDPICLAFSPDGKTFAVGSQGNDIVLLNTAGGSEVRKFHWHPSCMCLAFGADGKHLVTGDSSGQIARWEVATGKFLPAVPTPMPETVGGAVFTAEGRQVVTYGDSVAWWDADTGKPLRTVADPGFIHACSRVSPDGKSLAFFTGDRTAIKKSSVRLLNLATGTERVLFDKLEGIPAWLRFSPDGSRLAVPGRFRPNVYVLDVATGNLIHELKDHRTYLDHAEFSPDGKRIVSYGSEANANGDHEIHVWDAASGKLLHKLPPVRGSAFQIAFSPDSKQLVSVGGDPGRTNTKGEIHIWDLESGKLVRVWDGHRERVTCVAVSPDGRSILTGSLDRTLRLWDLATGRLRHEFAGHRACVMSVAFAPDGRRFVACSADAPCYVWDMYGHLTTKPAPLSADDFQRAWKDLADAEPAVGFRAVCRLAAGGDGAVTRLREVLKPLPTADAAKVDRWITELGSDRFAVREKAAAELAKVADQVRPRLRKALASDLTAEARDRVTKLLAAADGDEPEYRRGRRACEAIEAIGTKEARRLANEVAGGAVGARLTEEARGSAERLGRRP